MAVSLMYIIYIYIYIYCVSLSHHVFIIAPLSYHYIIFIYIYINTIYIPWWIMNCLSQILMPEVSPITGPSPFPPVATSSQEDFEEDHHRCFNFRLYSHPWRLDDKWGYPYGLVKNMYVYIYIYILVGGWAYPSETWWSSSVGMMTFPIYGKIKNVPNHQSVFIVVHKPKNMTGKPPLCNYIDSSNLILDGFIGGNLYHPNILYIYPSPYSIQRFHQVAWLSGEVWENAQVASVGHGVKLLETAKSRV